MFLIRIIFTYAVLALIGVWLEMWIEHFFGLGSMKSVFFYAFLIGVGYLFYSMFKDKR